MKRTDFTIPFTGLKPGAHKFSYEIDNEFFESFEYQEFNRASIQVDAVLDKRVATMELELVARGSVNVDCDSTREPFDQPLDGRLSLVIKFGEAFNDEDDELLILPHGEHQLDIAQYVYEMLVLAVPQKRIHPGVLDGSLDSEILDRLEELQPKGPDAEADEDSDTDPRWDGLKKLLTDKK